MRDYSRLLGLVLVVIAGRLPASAATNTTDICVYGGTSGGVIAAVQAARMGKSVSLVVDNNHLGGMTSGGLGWTDFGNTAAIGGLSRDYYMRVGAAYGAATPAFTFEPHVAEQVFRDLVTENAIPVFTNQLLTHAVMDGSNIVSLTMADGTVYAADVFIDATYEGDLLASAGVSYTVGRESNAQFGERVNGVVNPPRGTHNFDVGVDPYVTPGDPGSGLLPYVQDGVLESGGSADTRIQAYNFRLCLTTTATNQLPITAPPGYDPAQYELLARYLDARPGVGLRDLLKINPVPNNKTDINNNGPFSTDFIGQNWDYPEADAARRAEIRDAHLSYTRGLLHFLGNDARVPAAVRTNMLNYGLCKDEFQDTGGWPHQLYVREARRMVSAYVMTEDNCRDTIQPADSIGLAAYTMDSHNCRRYVQAGGTARNEGDVQDGIPGPYRIPYRAIVPRRDECANLLVPWSLSATHIAFGSIRMEPVLMILGQSAATAAAHAIDEGVDVQDVNVTNLQARLVDDDQVIAWGTPANARPNVELTSPPQGQVYGTNEVVVLEANAWDTDGMVTGVAFYANGYRIGTVTTTPYRITWTNPFPAQMAVNAFAVDDGGAENLSGTVSIRVGTSTSPGQAENGIIVDDADTTHVSLEGDWQTSASVPGFYGSGYIHDSNTGTGMHAAHFRPVLPVTGEYAAYIRFSAHENRATAVPVELVHVGGTESFVFDQSDARLNGRWLYMGTHTFARGVQGEVVVRNTGADGYVTADAVSVSLVTSNEAAPTNGGIYAWEYFNGYGSNEIDRLHGLAGGAGWLSTWMQDDATAPGYEAGRHTSYDVPDYAPHGNLATAVDGRAGMRPTDSGGSIARRSFAAPLTGTVWISCLVRHEANDVGDVLLWFETVTSGQEANMFVGLRAGDVPTLRYGGVEVEGAGLESAGKDLLFLVRISIDVSGAADAIDFWVLPESADVRTVAGLGTPTLGVGGSDVLGDSLTYMGFSGGSGRHANLDALRVSNRATSFADVVQPVTWPVLYETTFTGDVGALPVGWEVLVGDVGNPGWAIDSGGDFRLDQAGVNGLARYVGPLAGGGDAGELTNCLIEATFRKSDGVLTGLAMGTVDPGTFYHTRLQSQTALEIYRFIDGAAVRLGTPATATDTYNSGETWRIRLQRTGLVLVTDLFNQNDVLVGRVVTTDSTITNGFACLRGSTPSAYESFRIYGNVGEAPREGTVLLLR